jgi:hypothetical protein
MVKQNISFKINGAAFRHRAKQTEADWMQKIAILCVSIVYNLVFFYAFTNICVLNMFSVLQCWVHTPAAFPITIKKKVYLHLLYL